jgi:hypothetical protein
MIEVQAPRAERFVARILGTVGLLGSFHAAAESLNSDDVDEVNLCHDRALPEDAVVDPCRRAGADDWEMECKKIKRSMARCPWPLSDLTPTPHLSGRVVACLRDRSVPIYRTIPTCILGSFTNYLRGSNGRVYTQLDYPLDVGLLFIALSSPTAKAAAKAPNKITAALVHGLLG